MPKPLRFRVLASFLLVAFVGLTAAPAAAEDSRPTQRSSWYGWQTLLMDAGVFGITLATQNAYAFLVGYPLASPIVHFSHGHLANGFASLGLRVALPFAGAFTLAALERSAVVDGHEKGNAMTWGLLGGSLTASLLDAALLARTSESGPVRAATKTHLQVEPRVSASPRGAFAGVGGSF